MSCAHNEIENKIILKINDLEVSEYEFYKNLSKSSLPNLDTKTINRNDKEIIEYLRDYYFVCDALNLKYDTLSSFKKEIFYTSGFMMTQKYGYLWKNNVSPIVDNFKELNKNKLENRKRVFYFDVVLGHLFKTV